MNKKFDLKNMKFHLWKFGMQISHIGVTDGESEVYFHCCWDGYDFFLFAFVVRMIGY